MTRLNLHIYPSAFKHESRILKETKSIIDLGLADKIVIVAVWEEGLPEREQIDEKREVWRVKLPAKPAKRTIFSEASRYIRLMRKIYKEYKGSSVTHINCHSLAVLPIGVLFKRRKKGITLIYDAHELETLRNGLYGARQKFSALLEKVLIGFVDELIVVSESIAEWYRKTYRLKKVHVVRNVPYRENIPVKRSPILKEKFGIKGDEILFIYQGLIAKGRGIELLINTFSRAGTDKHLVIMGYGPMEEEVKAAALKYPNIHFHEAVKQHEIIEYTSGADIGLSIIENTCLSYYYCLPNKVFEYLMCGLPLVVSNFPDMSQLVDRYKCGWKVEVSSEELLELVNEIKSEEVKEKKNNALNAREHLGWHIEEKELMKAYER